MYMVLCSVVYVLYILQIRELRFSNVTVAWPGEMEESRINEAERIE